MDRTITIGLDPAFVQMVKDHEARLTRAEDMLLAATGALDALGTVVQASIGLRNNLESKILQLEEDSKRLTTQNEAIITAVCTIMDRVGVIATQARPDLWGGAEDTAFRAAYVEFCNVINQHP